MATPSSNGSGARFVIHKGRPPVLRTAAPEREVRKLLWRFRQSLRPMSRVTVTEARRALQLAIKAWGRREPVDRVIERQIYTRSGALRARVYVPFGEDVARPILVWFHGGGFVVGDLYTAGGTCRALANRSGAVVVAVDYRLVPENDLSDALEDCIAAVEWAARYGGEIGGDPSQIVVGGDSAGGMLAALVTQHCARRGSPAIRLQVLVYPATDLTSHYPSLEENADGYFLTRESIDWFKAQISGVTDLGDPRYSPLLTSDLRDLPPALVLTAGFDPIRDEGLAYVARLHAARVAVEGIHYPGQIHGFLCFDRILPGAVEALDHIGGRIAGVFAASTEEEGASDVARAVAARSGEPRVDGFFQRTLSEAIVTGIYVKDWLSEGTDALLHRVWRLWNLPSGSEIDRLRSQVEALARKVDALPSRIGGSASEERPDDAAPSRGA